MRWVITFLAGLIVGGAGGLALGFFIFPFVFPPPTAFETLTEAEKTRVVAEGTFIHANPSDPVHYGKGAVTVYEQVVFLGEDFEVGPGPAYRVYLVPKEMVRVNADLAGAQYVDLGGLRAFKGSQKYAIPVGVDLQKYPSVVIWCERFSVLISPADLKFAGS